MTVFDQSSINHSTKRYKFVLLICLENKQGKPCITEQTLKEDKKILIKNKECTWIYMLTCVKFVYNTHKYGIA